MVSIQLKAADVTYQTEHSGDLPRNFYNTHRPFEIAMQYPLTIYERSDPIMPQCSSALKLFQNFHWGKPNLKTSVLLLERDIDHGLRPTSEL